MPKNSVVTDPLNATASAILNGINSYLQSQTNRGNTLEDFFKDYKFAFKKYYLKKESL